MDEILAEIRNCTVCKEFLPNVPRPIIQASSVSTIMIIGQAPGRRVQGSGIPWDDASGNNLREWLRVDKNTFYNDEIFALIQWDSVFLVLENRAIGLLGLSVRRYGINKF